MYLTPNFNCPTSFMGIANRSPSARYVVVGIPFDLGTVDRPGTRFGANAIRTASRVVYDGEHFGKFVDPKKLDIADVGNMPIRTCVIEENYALVEQEALRYNHLIALGGDHSLTLPLLRAAAKKHGPLALIHFDAHTDCWPNTFGEKYGNSCVFHHAVTEKLIDPKAYVQIGIRAKLDKFVYDWIKTQGITTVTAEDVHTSTPAAIAAHIKHIVGNRPTYLTFDIDCFDPSAAPGTGSPECGGLLSWQGLGIVKRLDGINFIGMDLVEVSPPFDHAEITALLGATVVFEYLSLLAARPEAYSHSG